LILKEKKIKNFCRPSPPKLRYLYSKILFKNSNKKILHKMQLYKTQSKERRLNLNQRR